jgi:hypothetical protein
MYRIFAPGWRLCANCLGGRIVTMTTYGDTQGATEYAPHEWLGEIVHAALEAGARGPDVKPS